MQFGGSAKGPSARRRNRRLLLNSSYADCDYPHSLSMYADPPMSDISLQEFETIAYERVKVLHHLDSLSVSTQKFSQTYNEKLTEFLRKNYKGFLMTTSPDRQINDVENEWRRKDHISHFILRLAYCRSEELRRWFLDKEMDLFRFRFMREGPQSVQKFLQVNKLDYNPISDAEKARYSDKLSKITFEMNEAAVEKSAFYRVPFLEVLNLVQSRRVFLSEGDAFVPQKEFYTIICTKYREHLSKSLVLTSRVLPQMEEEDRLLPILKSFNQNALSTAYDAKKNEGSISLSEIDELSKKSFPLCMRQLHRSLKETHHMKHWGRQQFGLFLKGIGVTLQDSLKFWRQEFGKGVGVEKFEKQYAYNIRHNYGKEGKRTNYTPLNCKAIIMKNQPGPQDPHGCPFKHTSPSLLKQRLKSYNTPSDIIDEIVELVKGQHFQLACQKYFAASHNIDPDLIQVTHPNAYFDDSQRILKGERPMRKENSSNNTNDESSFTPQWSQPIKKEPQTQISTNNSIENEWEDESIDQMMMDYAEPAQ